MLQINNLVSHSLYQRLQKIIVILFFIALVFSEWRFIGLPIKGRPFTISFNQYLSISLFEIVMFVLFIILIPVQLKAIADAIRKPLKIINWVFCFCLLCYLFYSLRPSLPYLSPIEQNVINVRSLFLCMLSAYVTFVAVQQYQLIKILKFQYYLFFGISLMFLILSLCAINEVLFFRQNYPFNVPSTISFPFPSQNIAAFFIVIVFIGLCKISFFFKSRILPILCIPSLMLAISMTGSRSCFILTLAICTSLLLYAKINKKVHEFRYLFIGLLLAATVIGYNYNWQPVARSTSMLYYLVNSPSLLIKSISESPRLKMWKNTLQKTKDSDRNKSNKNDSLVSSKIYNMYLMKVTEGEMEILGEINELSADKIYLVTFSISGSNGNMKKIVVTVATGGDQEKTVNTLYAETELCNMPHFYRFVSDSSKSYIDRAGEIKFIDDMSEVLSKAKLTELYESPYNGGGSNVIAISESKIKFDANEKKLIGYVNDKNGGYKLGQETKRKFWLKVSRMSYSLPLDAPTIFLTGFHDTKKLSGDGWKSIRNGLLLMHSRGQEQWERYQQKTLLEEEIYLRLSTEKGQRWNEADVKDMWKKIRSDESLKARKIAYLWKTPLDSDNISLVSGNKVFNASIDKEKRNKMIAFSTLISTSASRVWDHQKYLSKNASTHNSYLDLYYYTGIVPLILFVLFIVSTVIIGFHSLLSAKKTRSDIVLLHLFIQVIVIALLLFAHPYIWMKFIWVFLGYATSIFIRNNSQYNFQIKE